MVISMRRALFFGLILLGSLLSLAAQSTNSRFALVVGNGSYTDLGKLKNPVNDATDIAAELKDLGFQVTLLTNADLPTMEDAVQRLGSALSQSADSIGFFFYAGHGVQASGVNFLIPADAHIISESYLKTKALAAQSILDSLQGARNALNVVVLDACRDNPFSWGRSAARGLSVVGSQPPGSIVVYATSTGSVAEDGTGRNGVFTTELLKQLRVPGVEIKEVFTRTGAAVQSATAGRQVPAVYNQFFGNAYLAGVAPAPATQPSANQSPSVTTAPTAAPTITITRSYGSILVSTGLAGELYLDGVKLADMPQGAKAKLDNIAVGTRKIELRLPDGRSMKRDIIVQEGQTATASFDMPSSPPPPAPLPAPGRGGR